MTVAGMAGPVAANADNPYAGTLEQLCSDIAAALPPFDDAVRQSIVGAKDSKARVEALRKAAVLDKFLADDVLDAKLVNHFILHDATPVALAAYAGKGGKQKGLIDALLADDRLMLQIAAPPPTPGNAR